MTELAVRLRTKVWIGEVVLAFTCSSDADIAAVRRPAGVVIHTRPDEEEIDTVWREGLPLTAPARTLIDVAGELQPEQLEMVLRQALGRGLLTARELEEEARGRGRHSPVSGVLAAVTL